MAFYDIGHIFNDVYSPESGSLKAYTAVGNLLNTVYDPDKNALRVNVSGSTGGNGASGYSGYSGYSRIGYSGYSGNVSNVISTGIDGPIPTFIDYGGLSGYVGACTSSLFNNDTFQGIPEKYIISGTIFNVADNTGNYLYADYNNGSPIYKCSPDVSLINESNTIPINSIFVADGEMHFSHWDQEADDCQINYIEDL